MSISNMKDFVGNDLVDLNTDDARNYPRNINYVKRVLTEAERECLLASDNPDLLFWIYWSAKEAVFKIIKKIDSDSTLSFKLFKLDLVEITTGAASGYVTYDGRKHYVDFTITPQWIHCISVPMTKVGKILSVVRPNNEIRTDHFLFSEQEKKSIHSQESLLARCLVKKILTDDFKKQFEIRRPVLLKKFGPPQVWYENKRVSNIDISISHDGNYCAGLVLFKQPAVGAQTL